MLVYTSTLVNYSMFHIENCVNRTNGSCSGNLKNIPIHYGFMGGNYLKRHLTSLFCTKCNENNIGYSDVQKHVYCKRWYKQH